MPGSSEFSNSRSHLKRKHVTDVYSSSSSRTETRSSPQGDPRIPRTGTSSVTLMHNACDEQRSNKSRKKNIDLDLLDFCMGGLHPFSIVEERGFKKLCRWIPGYELPTQSEFDSIMQEEYSNLHEKVVSQLSKVKNICLTAGMWTPLKTESYLALTGHYFNEELDMKTVLLGCCQLSDTSSTNIAEAIWKLVDKYDLKSKVNFMITNDALKAVREELGWKHFGCCADSLNSIVEDALENVKPQIEEVKQVVSYVKNSTSCCKMLEEYQIQHGQSPKPLIQALDTSWNSTFLMLKRFIELEDAVKSTLASVVRDAFKIKEEEWTLYKELCRILSPFDEITTSLMSDENYGTGSCIIAMTCCLSEECQRLLAKTGLSKKSRKTAQLLESGLKERFKAIEKSGTLSINTFLDPRFKTHGFSNQIEAMRTKERIRKMIVEMIAKAELITIPDNDEDDSSPWKTIDREICQGTPMSMALEEVDKFLSDKMLPREDASGNSTSPQEWWRLHKDRYPNLKKIYETKCNIVATSVLCEQIISETRLRLKSNRLTSSELEQIMFLVVNSPEKRFAGF
ncbi:zinc finger BED domain-containing protein DAYSLEEPER-like [Coccinella septempunctata]|uniref:zinc finger BED domain-containing protein DAYSLEEPER-like n=1 Tax=Coccinella septempunctata TaxID=41139 RepID=UPI001D0955AB|nr:zinc finger BED domain-containing protein DAYSLEEPER-like [Coccinella septempunctata]